MTRRSFFLKSAMAAFGFAILPGAGRIWKPTRPDPRGWGFSFTPSARCMDTSDFSYLLVGKDGLMVRFNLNAKTNVYEPEGPLPPELRKHNPNYTTPGIAVEDYRTPRAFGAFDA